MADEKREPARVPGTRHGPGGRMGGGEKAKDFRGSLARLTGYCRTWLPAVIAAMALALLLVISMLFSMILSFIG